MTEAEYAYTTRWNARTGRPVAEHVWLDEIGSREVFAAHNLEVVRVVKRRESDGAVRAAWVMGLAYKAGVRVQWFQGQHTVWRLNDYQWFGDRLFRTVTTSYDYPDTERRYDFNECIELRSLVVLPDGTGHTMVGPGHAGRRGAWVEDRQIENFSGYRTDNLWIDYPEFGDWEPLADASFGGDQE